eukprot:Skav227397  [mRNA]  locus=scaffold3215:291622:314652:- [translate_table: standard]
MERIFCRASLGEVQQVQPELAPKLTGMLLQLGEEECWACLEDHEKLAVRLDEAPSGQHNHSQFLWQAGAPRRPAAETRIDPEDGVARRVGPGRCLSFAELQKHYAGQYSAQEIKDYWEHCKGAAPAAKAAAKAVSSPAPKAAPAGPMGPRSSASKAAQAKAVSEAPAAPKVAAWGAWRRGFAGAGAMGWQRLEHYLSAAEKWAEDQGAVSVEDAGMELVEFGEDFAQEPSGQPGNSLGMASFGAAVAAATGPAPRSGSEAADSAEESGADDDLHEGRNAQLDTERDIAARGPRGRSWMGWRLGGPGELSCEAMICRMAPEALSRVDVEPDEAPAPTRPAARAQHAPRTAPERRVEPEEPRRYARGQGFGGGTPVAPAMVDTNASYGPGVPTALGVPSQEKRMDPEDGKAKTFKAGELQAEYTHLYSPHEISEYWNECAPASASGQNAVPEPPAKPVARSPPGLPPAKSQPWGAGGSKLRF